MKRLAIILVVFFLFLTSCSEAAPLSEIGLNSSLPTGWSAQQSKRDKMIFSLFDEKGHYICVISYAGAAQSTPEAIQTLKSFANQKSNDYDYSQAHISNYTYQPYTFSALSAPSLQYSGKYGHTIIIPYNQKSYWLLFSSSHKETESVFQEHNTLFEALFPSTASSSITVSDYLSGSSTSSNSFTSTSSSTSSYSSETSSWIDPYTGFVFPVPSGMKIAEQGPTKVVFRSGSSQLIIATKPQSGSSFSGWSNRIWPRIVSDYRQRGYTHVNQFKTAGIWTFYFGNYSENIAHFDFRKRTFYLYWKNTHRQDTFDYLNSLEKPPKPK